MGIGSLFLGVLKVLSDHQVDILRCVHISSVMSGLGLSAICLRAAIRRRHERPRHPGYRLNMIQMGLGFTILASFIWPTWGYFRFSPDLAIVAPIWFRILVSVAFTTLASAFIVHVQPRHVNRSMMFFAWFCMVASVALMFMAWPWG